jgi:hypothetical protein
MIDAGFVQEIGKLIAPIAVTALIGLLLLRRIEGVKALVAKEAEFHKKWGEQFFECSQKFMQAVERELAILTSLANFKLGDENEWFEVELRHELFRLIPTIMELDLRIRRIVEFAPSSCYAVKNASSECIKLTSALISSRQGSLDDIIKKIDEFNKASINAHAEMLRISREQ